MTKYLKNGEMSEESIQKSIIEWISIHPDIKKYSKYIIHIPNEGKRTPRYGKKLKDMGMRPGVSDLFIAIPRKGFNGAWVELKSKSGTLSKSQFEFLKDMEMQNYCTNSCNSFEEFTIFILWYLDIKK